VIDESTGARRDDPVVYQIRSQSEKANFGGDDLTLDINARTTNPDKLTSECPLKWQLEMEVPYQSEWDGSWYSRWEVIRDSDNIALHLDAAPYQFALTISQEDYLEHWAARNGTTRPEDTQLIKFRFGIWDPTKAWKDVTHDEFTVEVRSSKETQASFCAYDNLSIDETISGFREYTAGVTEAETEYFDIFVSTNIVDSSNTVSDDCKDDLTMSLEMLIPDGDEEYWSAIQDVNTP
jgi:hypothetical protein